jgi:hypothetical protein
MTLTLLELSPLRGRAPRRSWPQSSTRSRFVCESRYDLHEDFAALRFGFSPLLLGSGRPVKLYVTIGSVAPEVSQPSPPVARQNLVRRLD